MKILRWFYLLPFWPFILLVSEIEKFGKYIKWGKCDLDDAYHMGYSLGRSNATEQFELMLPELFDKIKNGMASCVAEYNASIETVEERPIAYDYETGEVCGRARLVTAKDFCIQIVVGPKTKYFFMPMRSEISDMCRTQV